MSRVQLPHLPEPRVPHFDRAQTHRLSNGVEVYVVERHELPVVDVRVVVRGGAAADGALQAGRAWMVAELLDQGAGTRDALAIADEVDFLGASIECRASWDFMSAGLHVLVPRLDAALDLLADIVLRPTFPSIELERKRQERFAAILRERDDPRSLATHTFTRLAYGVDHPYGHPIGGTRESIERLTLDDVHACHAARFTATARSSSSLAT